MKNLVYVRGQIGTGKTMFMQKLIHKAVESSIPVYGFLQPCFYQEKTRTKYDVVSYANDKIIRLPFASLVDKVDKDGWIWNFNQKSIEDTRQFFDNMEIIKKPSILVIDEFGRLESKGKGHWNSIYTLIRKMTESNIHFSPVITCRKQTHQLLRDTLSKNFGFRKENMLIQLPVDIKKENDYINKIVCKVK